MTEPTNPQTWKRFSPDDKQAVRDWRDAEFYQNKLLFYGNIDTDEAREICRLTRYDLSETLQRLGRCDEALAVAVDEAQKARCEALKHAIDCDDGECCDCPNPVVEAVTGFDATGEAHMKTLMVASRFSTERVVFSLKHGKIMRVRKCSQCGHLNATDQMGDEIHLKQERGTRVRTLIDAQTMGKHDMSRKEHQHER